MKTLFVINPLSGGRQNLDRLKLSIRLNFPEARVMLTEHAGHATQIAEAAVAENYGAVIVAGGDGTINETARALIGTQTALGIIPKGSGNGFARGIGMPMQTEEAVASLQHARYAACDVGSVNEEYFINLAGVGIEAEIARAFMYAGQYGRRGMLPYFQLGAQQFLSYQPKKLRVTFDGREETITPMTLVFANGTQYGSNFKIAPHAELSDGRLDMVEVKNVSKWKLAAAAPTFFFKDFRPIDVTRVRRVQNATVEFDGEIVYHIDGEVRSAQEKLEIKTHPKALKVLMPYF